MHDSNLNRKLLRKYNQLFDIKEYVVAKNKDLEEHMSLIKKEPLIQGLC